MYNRLAKRLALTTQLATWILIDPPPAIVVRRSQPVSMEGANAIMCDFTIININSTNGLELSVQGSNDLENWEENAPPGTLVAPGYTLVPPLFDIDFAFVRLEYKMWQTQADFLIAPAYAVLSAGMDTFAE